MVPHMPRVVSFQQGRDQAHQSNQRCIVGVLLSISFFVKMRKIQGN